MELHIHTALVAHLVHSQVEDIQVADIQVEDSQVEVVDTLAEVEDSQVDLELDNTVDSLVVDSRDIQAETEAFQVELQCNLVQFQLSTTTVTTLSIY